MQHKNEVPNRNIIEMFPRLCKPAKLYAHEFKILLSFTASKITEKVELTNNATGKTKAFLRIHYDNCLDAANILFSNHQTIDTFLDSRIQKIDSAALF